MTRLPDDNEGGPPVYRIEGNGPTLFLEVAPCADGYVPGQNEANARLIAAAPELLSACRGARNDLSDELEDCTSPGSRESLENRIAYLDRVIAKAEGKDAPHAPDLH
jgi:hypothetical protein